MRSWRVGTRLKNSSNCSLGRDGSLQQRDMDRVSVRSCIDSPALSLESSLRSRSAVDVVVLGHTKDLSGLLEAHDKDQVVAYIGGFETPYVKHALPYR
jgi:hypothetical protein